MEKSVSDEEILAWFRKGYRLHKKRVKKYTYIVVRRGQEMHSLGPYTDEKWKRCIRLEYKFATETDETLEATEELDQEETLSDKRNRASQRFKNITDDYLREVERARGFKKWVKCVHLENLFCTYWRWDNEREKMLLRNIRELNAFIYAPVEMGVKYINDNGKEKFILKANQIYCSTCTAYEEQRSLT